MATNSLICISNHQDTYGNILQNRKERRGHPEHEDPLWKCFKIELRKTGMANVTGIFNIRHSVCNFFQKQSII